MLASFQHFLLKQLYIVEQQLGEMLFQNICYNKLIEH